MALNNKQKIKLSIFLSIILSSNTSFASENLGTVEVNGYKNEKTKNLEDIFLKPFSKKTISKKKIEEESFVDIAESIRDVSGVTVSESGSFTKSTKIRGLGGDRTTVLIDGVKLGNQGMTKYGSAEMGMINISNVKKIEVIKGSPSVIYDPGASAGVINIHTQDVSNKKDISFEQKLEYDGGYSSKKSTSIIEAGNGTIGARVLYSKQDAQDYKISGNAEDRKLFVETVNILEALQNNGLKNASVIEDLGFDTEYLSISGNAKLGEDGNLQVKVDDWEGNDIIVIFGDSIYKAGALQYDNMKNKSKLISYKKKKLGSLNNSFIQYSTNEQEQLKDKNSIPVKLTSKQFNFMSDYILENSLLKFGTEIRSDDAKTRVYAKENYKAAFLNSEYILDNWIFTAGVRYNTWTTKQRLLDGTDPIIAQNLVGISGTTSNVKKSSYTMSFATQYLPDDYNNFSLNLNTTYRNPNLMEKYSFDGVIGGGLNLKPEEGKHAEVSWKYLKDKSAFNISTFYSRFKNYIQTKTKSQITNKNALEMCIQRGDCNIANNDFDGRENEFFTTYQTYYNVKDKVSNWGIELEYNYETVKHEFDFTSSFNKINSKDKFVQANSNPIDTVLSYKYKFANSWKPWIKIKGQYVLNQPKVEQERGFSSYFISNLYFGFKKNKFTINSGVRNILNKVYHTAYSGINALERSYFINASYKF